ncbi:MAG: T9SS type A sorting domain-containing protein [Vicingaceae bacterium]
MKAFLAFLSIFIFSNLASAQTSCLPVNGLSLQPRSLTICPKEQRTLRLINPPYQSQNIFYKLNSSQWNENNPTSSGLNGFADLHNGTEGEVYGLYNEVVYKLKDSSWTQITNPLPGGQTALSLALGITDEIFVVAESSVNRLNVWNWNGTAWSRIGNADFSTFNPEDVEIEVEGVSTPRVAFINDSANDWASVMEVVNSTWQYMGFVQIGTGQSTEIDLEVSGNDTYLATSNTNVSSAYLEVWRFSVGSGNWVQQGNNPISFNVIDIDLECIGSTLYLAYSDLFSSTGVYVDRFTTSWQSMGQMDGSYNGVSTTLEIHRNHPVVSFKSQNNKTQILEWVGGQWQPFMPAFYSSVSIETFKIDEVGWPVLYHSGDFIEYMGRNIPSSLNDTLNIYAEGIYTSESVDSCGVRKRSSTTVIEYPNIAEYEYMIDSLRCKGDTNGGIRLRNLTQLGIDSIKWNTGENDLELDNLGEGIYYATVYTGSCVIQDTIILDPPDSIQSSFTVINESCDFQYDGEILAQSSGGVPPYDYSINGLVNWQNNIRNLTAGSYNVISTDSFGCYRVDPVNVGTNGTFFPAEISMEDTLTICGDSIELVLDSTYQSAKWYQLDSLETQSIGNPLGSRKIYRDTKGRLILATVSINTSNSISRYENGSWNNIFNFSRFNPFVEYKKGVLIVGNQVGSDYEVSVLDDNATNWQNLADLTTSHDLIDFTIYNGIIYLLTTRSSDLVVLKYNAGRQKWEQVSSIIGDAHQRQKSFIKVNRNNELFVFDVDSDDNLYIKKLQNQNWVTLDSASLKVEYNSSTRHNYEVEINENNEILLAYEVYGTKESRLERFDGMQWTVVETFERECYGNIDIELKNTSQPILAIVDKPQNSNQSNLSIYRLEDSIWTSHQTNLTIGSLIVGRDDSIWVATGNDVLSLTPSLLSDSSHLQVGEEKLLRLRATDGNCIGSSGLVQLKRSTETNTSLLNEVSCAGDTDGVARVIVSEERGRPPFHYQWSNGVTSDSLLGVSVGWYYVSVTDQNNCIVVDSVYIREPLPLEIDSVNYSTPSCNGIADATVQAYASGGRTPYTYNWGLGFNQKATTVVQTSGSKQLILLDSSQCSDTIQYTVPSGQSSMSHLNISTPSGTYCIKDSIVLSSNLTGAHQWFSMDTGSWNVKQPNSLIGTNPSSPIWVADFDISTNGNFYIATRDNYSGWGNADILLYDGLNIGPIRPKVWEDDDVLDIKIAINEQEQIFAALHIDSHSDSIKLLFWNGEKWNALYTGSDSEYKGFDLVYDSLSNKVTFGYLSSSDSLSIYETTGNNMNLINTGNLLGFNHRNLDLTTDNNGNVYALVGSSNFLRINSGNAVSLSIPASNNNGQVKANDNGDLFVLVNSNDRVYKRLDSVWKEYPRLSGPAPDRLFVSPNGIPFLGRDSILYQYNGTEWIKTATYPNLSRGFQMRFNKQGIPIVASRIEFSNNVLPLLLEFQPKALNGATNDSLVVNDRAHLMLQVNDGTCVRNEVVSIATPSIAFQDFYQEPCPGDSLLIDYEVLNFQDTITSYLWSTGDTIKQPYLTAGKYALTVSDGNCTISDSVEVDEYPRLKVTIDSLEGVSCYGETDGYIKIDIDSDYGYRVDWFGFTPWQETSVLNMPPGEHQVEVSPYYGCYYADTIDFTIPEPSEVPAANTTNASNYELCDNPISLSASSQGAAVKWYSFDSVKLANNRFDLNFVTEAAVEINGELYAGGRLLYSEPGIYQREGNRWEAVYLFDDEFGGVVALTTDTANNFIAGLLKGGFSNRALEVWRIGTNDTTLLSSIPMPLTYNSNFSLFFLNGRLVLSYIHATSSTNSGTLIMEEFNGSAWNPINSPPTNNVLGNGFERRITVKRDRFGTTWFYYSRRSGSRYFGEVYRYQNGNWQRRYRNIGGLPKIHRMENGEFWTVSSSRIIKRGLSIDTIMSRHPEMNTSLSDYDISQDPEGYPLLLEDGKIYRYKYNKWEKIAELFTQFTDGKIFFERACKYPSIKDNYSLKELLAANLVSSNSNYSASKSGVYQAYSEQGGCVNYNSCVIAVSSPFDIEIEQVDSIICGADTTASLKLNIETDLDSNQYSVSWNTGDTTSIIDSLSAGLYWVEVTGPNNCFKRDTLIVEAPPKIQIHLDSLFNASCNSANGKVYTSVSGGSGELSLSWSNNDTTAIIQNLDTGIYVLNVQDSLNCNVSQSFIIDRFDTLSPMLLVTNDTVFLGQNGSVQIQSQDVVISANDACGIDSLWLSKSSFNCGDTLEKVYVQAIDFKGNTTIDSVHITVLDTIAPKFDCPQDTAICEGVFNYDTLSVVENCSAKFQHLSGPFSGDNLSAGLYQVNYQFEDTYQNVVNCSFNLKVDSIAPLDLGKDTLILLGDSITLYGDTMFDQYQWSNSATADSITVKPIDTTLYWLRAFNGACLSIDSIMVFVDQTVGDLRNEKNHHGIVLYPNPAKKDLFLEIDKFSSMKSNGEILIYQQNGKLLKNIEVTKSRSRIDISALSKGIYLVRFNSDRLSKSWKIVVL